MIKLLALDLDGTLLNDEKKISVANKNALKKAQELGIKVVITTGRPLVAIQPFVEMLELRGPKEYAITFNGGLVQQIKTGKILAKTVLDVKKIPQVAEVFSQMNLPLSVVSEEKVFEFKTSSHESIYKSLNPRLIYQNTTPEKLPEDRIYNKMVSAVSATILDQQLPRLPESLKSQFEIMKSRDCLLEILPKGVEKGRALAILGEQLNIQLSEMMSFGDEENDLSMIKACGIGVVMENGNPEVKKQADFITKSNQEDGVAFAIEKFILKGEN
ncbi:Cof-type HAD-IIB family hydrolase [Enterococcus timonensis]|uniref:Cof-type HAD-IIB family hydrolase n=1 Tax=Enterococcus timonensis TaxID=1852364 RepID=UPI0008D8FD16|nr:Cof-type HAD-IIB family hydrolase [Enterococcus timonensis]